MAVINGHYLRIYIGGTAIAKATECSLSLSAEMRETSHKDTSGDGGGWREVTPGEKAGTLTCNALFAETESYETLWTAYSTGASVSWIFQDGTTGNLADSGTGYISSLEKNAPNNENVTYSVTIEVTGAITRAAQA